MPKLVHYFFIFFLLVIRVPLPERRRGELQSVRATDAWCYEAAILDKYDEAYKVQMCWLGFR